MDPKSKLYQTQMATKIKEDANFVYYRDINNKLRKFSKTSEYESKKDSIRLKFLEKPYKFWKSMKYDNRGNFIAFGICCIIPYLVYRTALWHTERDIRIEIMGTLPADVADKKKFEKYLENKKKMKEEMENEAKQEQNH